MRHRHPVLVIVAYGIGGPLIGALVVFVYALYRVDTSHPLEGYARALLGFLIYGVAFGVVPGVGTSFVHLTLQRRTLTRQQFVCAVCGAGAAIAVGVAGVLTAKISGWHFVVVMGAAGALASLVIAWILTRETSSAT